jgi:hypothetical protein
LGGKNRIHEKINKILKPKGGKTFYSCEVVQCTRFELVVIVVLLKIVKIYVTTVEAF